MCFKVLPSEKFHGKERLVVLSSPMAKMVQMFGWFSAEDAKLTRRRTSQGKPTKTETLGRSGL